MKANGYPNASSVLNLIEERIKKQQEMAQMPQEGEMQDVMPEMLG